MRMKSLLRQSLADGSLGLSTSNSATHNDHFGEPVPSRSADPAEFVELAGVCREFEGSQVEIQPGIEFDEATARLLSDMSLASQRTVNWNAMFTIQLDADTLKLVDRQLALSDYARERGGRVVGLTVPVTGGVHADLIRGCGFFDAVPGWELFFQLSVAERVQALRNPSYRAHLKQCIEATLETSVVAKLIGVADRLIVELGYTPATQRWQEKSIEAIGHATGRSTLDTFFDIAAEDDLRTLFSLTPIGEDAENYRKRLKLWRDERLCVGGSDAGAHVETIDTFNFFTRLLARPVRELAVLSLEECVHHLTQAPARLMGIKDRGELRVGAWADIAIFDKDTVDTAPVETCNDFPAGARRLFADSIGMERVMVRGTTVLHRGRDTGARPGQFLVRARDTETVGLV
jgi:N-acyl-D-aspartate/D-glutamate deacylase